MPNDYSDITSWKPLGSGSYNIAYKHKTEPLVLKTQKTSDFLDNPSRSVRLWNEINPDIEPKAFICGYKDKKNQCQVGWVAPYIEGRQSTDDEIAKKVLEIYQRTGRILSDACSARNFITTPEGKVICVDIGLALQLEKREEENRSFISLDAWQNTAEGFTKYFKDIEGTHPKTLKTIKALLVLKDTAPDLDVEDLSKNNPEWSTQYAKQYKAPSSEGEPSWEKHSEIQHEQEQKLVNEAVSLAIKKDFSIKRLSQYISSRGGMNHMGVFKPSILTRIFRNQRLTERKVSLAKELIEKIEKATDRAQLEEALNIGAEHFKAGRFFGSNLERAIKACKFELEIIHKRYPLRPEPLQKPGP